ncbi:GNAT family N-acetyltransferase [Mycobacterium sp. NPDC003449]
MNAAAFPTELEANLVDALRDDPDAWIDGLSIVACDRAGVIMGYALLTRCAIGGEPALALGPCAVVPDAQRSGAGSAAIRMGLEEARIRGENPVVVLGHAEYYPRFGFTPASRLGIAAPFAVPDDTFLALALDPERAVPCGEVVYPKAFGLSTE